VEKLLFQAVILVRLHAPSSPAMKNNAFLHIGTAKTGTSSLQQWFFKNEKSLNDNYSVKYANSYRHKAAHHELAKKINTNFSHDHKFRAELIKPEDILSEEDIRNSLEKELNGASRTVVFSSESFSTLTKSEDIHILKRTLRDYEVKVVVYIRHIIDQLEASYAQGVKADKTKRTEKITQSRSPEKITNGNFTNRKRMIDLWGNVFGTENIIVRPYEGDLMVNHDIVSDFIHHTEILDLQKIASDKSLDFSRKVDNISLPTFKTEILRRLNDSTFFDEMSLRHRNHFIRKLRKAKMEVPDHINFFSRELAVTLMNTFKDRELALVKKYLPDLENRFTSVSEKKYIDDLPEENKKYYFDYIEDTCQQYLANKEKYLRAVNRKFAHMIEKV